jgi:hypothetical protein
MKPLFGLSKGPTGVFKSVLDTSRTDGKRRDEIYVDVVERLAVTFNAAGHAISSQIDGSIQVRACVRVCVYASVVGAACSSLLTHQLELHIQRVLCRLMLCTLPPNARRSRATSQATHPSKSS